MEYIALGIAVIVALWVIGVFGGELLAHDVWESDAFNWIALGLFLLVKGAVVTGVAYGIGRVIQG